MLAFNTEAFANRWHQMSLAEQMGNIGSEVDRIASWKKKGNEDYARNALYRSLELLDLTIADPRWRYRLKEILRVREFLCDMYLGDNTYGFTPEYFSKYFLWFAMAARGRRG
jgi:hypothetical protein